MNNTPLIARQPICDESLQVIGFELLYRPPVSENPINHSDKNNNARPIEDEDSATIDVLLAAYNDLSIDDVVGKQLAFVNFTNNIIINNLPSLPPKQLVIELLEGQEVTAELIEALQKLRSQNYKIALDDFSLNKQTLSLISCADIIKVDVLDQSIQEWGKYIPALKKRGITMLAEKVETYEMFDECAALGFDLFQGYFFSKPKIINGKKMSSNEIAVINLLSKLNASDADYDEIVQIISADISLSYNLLRIVNSGMYTLSTKVDSIRQAAVTLGLNNLKNWINLLALGSLDNKPSILLETAMIRAKMCESIGKHIHQQKTADDFFTVGLFSIIDAFFDMPISTLIDKLSLSDEMRTALLNKEGVMGQTLQAVMQQQKGDMTKELFDTLKKHNIEEQQFTQYYLESITWAKAETKH